MLAYRVSNTANASSTSLPFDRISAINSAGARVSSLFLALGFTAFKSYTASSIACAFAFNSRDSASSLRASASSCAILSAFASPFFASFSSF